MQGGQIRLDVVTLNGSRHANMKEIRFSAAGGTWRVAFAFDPERRAILLGAGDRSGAGERRFYRALIARADARFDRHLARLAGNLASRRRYEKLDAADNLYSMSRSTRRRGCETGGSAPPSRRGPAVDGT